MDETAVRSLLAVASRDDDAPPCGVSLPLARRRGRRRLRLLRVYLPGAAPVAAGVAMALVVALPAALDAGSSRAGDRPARSGAGPTVLAPNRFDPLVPYAAFGWLPDGFATTAAAGASDESTQAQLLLEALAPVSDGRMVQVRVDAAGTCQIGPASAVLARVPALRARRINLSPSAQTLLCTDPDGQYRIAELAGAAPDVNGQPAYWTTEGALDWQYAPGAWAEVMPMANQQACVHCTSNNLAGWENGPAGAGSARPGQPAPAPTASPQSAASQAILMKIAAGLRYGETEPLVFGFRLAAFPAGWHVAADYTFAPQAGRLVADGISAGPTVNPGALSVEVSAAVSPTSEHACKVIPGQSNPITLDGAPAVLRYLDAPENLFQLLCINSIDGVSVNVALELKSPAGNAPLPGTETFGSVLAVFRSVQLLGPDVGAWTTDPLG